MSNMRDKLDAVGFSQEEKRELAARLAKAAEERPVEHRGQSSIKRLRRGLMVAVAAVLTMTVGVLAAAWPGDWGGLFTVQTSEEQALLDRVTCEIGQTKTVDGWEITLSRCAGDDRMLYIWVEMKAPDGFVNEPPEEYMELFTYWDILMDGKQKQAGSGDMRFDWDEETRTLSYWSSWPTGDPVAGKTVDIALEPLRWDGWDPEGEKWVDIPLWDSGVTFEGVELDYPDSSIRLAPNIQVPYLDGTATLTRLEISPFRAFARVDGGSCYLHHHCWVKEEDGSQDELGREETPEAGPIDMEGSFGELPVREGYRLALDTIDCWSDLEVEFHMKDGTVITPRTAVLSDCQDGFETEDRSYAGECYVERRMEYEATPVYGMPDRIIDPSQVDYVAVCGMNIPVDAEK